MNDGQCFFVGFALAAFISVVTGIFLTVRPNTKISQ